jgi:hypothetical protein
LVPAVNIKRPEDPIDKRRPLSVDPAVYVAGVDVQKDRIEIFIVAAPTIEPQKIDA